MGVAGRSCKGNREGAEAGGGQGGRDRMIRDRERMEDR